MTFSGKIDCLVKILSFPTSCDFGHKDLHLMRIENNPLKRKISNYLLVTEHALKLMWVYFIGW